MRWIVIAASLVLSAPASAEMSAKEYCRAVDRQVKNATYPQRLDDWTTLASTEAMYVQGRCVVQNRIEVDSGGLIESTTNARNAQGIGTHRDTVVEALLSRDGRESMIDSLQAGFRQSQSEAMAIPNVTVYAIYQTSKPIPPFTITIESEPAP